MKKLILLFIFQTVGLFARPTIGPERAVLHTVGGDVALGFYSQSAPRTSAQLLKIMRAGVFNSTHFFRLENGFVLQIAQVLDRQIPLTPVQSAMIQRLPLELDPQVKHLTWRLSMARLTEDKNSGETSFSILLGDSPHLDGGYTVFGEVVGGFDAVNEMVKVGKDSLNRPLTRLGIERVSVFENESAMAGVPLLPARKVVPKVVTLQETEAKLRLLLGSGLLLILTVSLLTFAFRSRLEAQQLVALHQLQVLLSGFFLAMLWIPVGQQWPWFAAALFMGCIGLFKLMNRFEAAT